MTKVSRVRSKIWRLVIQIVTSIGWVRLSVSTLSANNFGICLLYQISFYPLNPLYGGFCLAYWVHWWMASCLRKMPIFIFSWFWVTVKSVLIASRNSDIIIFHTSFNDGCYILLHSEDKTGSARALELIKRCGWGNTGEILEYDRYWVHIDSKNHEKSKQAFSKARGHASMHSICQTKSPI